MRGSWITPRKTHELINGVWHPLRPISRTAAARRNFLIACEYGDWSGFRTLAECTAQVPGSWANRPVGFYWIEER